MKKRSYRSDRNWSIFHVAQRGCEYCGVILLSLVGGLPCQAALGESADVEQREIAVSRSPYAKLRPVSMHEATWTEGFWADRFRRCRTTTIPAVEEGLRSPDNSEQLAVLLIAAGLKEGDRQERGTNWTDGDCYKWIEALARQYDVNKDPALRRKMDDWIDVIRQAQSPDGYLSTNFWNDPAGRLQMPYFHEMYNMGHLLTAASVHYRATGKHNFLDIAKKNADFLYRQFSPRPPRLVHFPWNPSAYMGLIDLYRVTGDRKYLKLANILIDNRGSSPAVVHIATVARIRRRIAFHCAKRPRPWGMLFARPISTAAPRISTRKPASKPCSRPCSGFGET
ncbi:MAG: beta-L-arabinofuranosidase domain-containing protein [Planctomycetota bacterium]